MALLELIHVTAQYSNAVLIAVLPHVTEFAKKLELPVPLPITTNHVRKIAIVRLPDKGDVPGHVVLTNGYTFWFRHGFVEGFKAPKDYFGEQDINQITNYLGVIHMSTNEVITQARVALKKLGYTERDLPFGGPPEIRGGEWFQGHAIPYFRVEWTSPARFPMAQVDINAEQKAIIGLQVIGTNLWRPSFKVDVVPELESDFRKRNNGINSQFQEAAPQRLPARTGPTVYKE